MPGENFNHYLHDKFPKQHGLFVEIPTLHTGRKTNITWLISTTAHHFFVIQSLVVWRQKYTYSLLPVLHSTFAVGKFILRHLILLISNYRSNNINCSSINDRCIDTHKYTHTQSQQHQ